MASTGRDTFQAAQEANVVLPLAQSNENAFRLEIDELLGDNALANLYLLGLVELMKNSVKAANSAQPNWWSYYSLGGIHGLPREGWTDFENTTRTGYCHHGMNTFPTWHRPYMYQFEQAVYSHMASVTEQFTDPQYRQLYADALTRFRLPYWDPCMPRYSSPNAALPKVQRANAWRWGFPRILKAKTVFVRLPSNPADLTEIENPLYRFNFPTAEEFQDVEVNRPQINWRDASLGWTQSPSTGRWRFNPDSFHADFTTRSPTAQSSGDSDNNFLEVKIQLQMQEMATNLWHLLNPDEVSLDEVTGQDVQVNRLRSWDIFAKHRSSNVDLSRQSLESWHDNIHDLVGTGQSFFGHMGDPAVAAFDPVFWMHHCNIDRILALFQALYPDKFVTAGKRDESNPPLSSNDPTLFADDELLPFRKNGRNECWSSTEVRDYAAVGYAVPGTKLLNERGRDAIALYLRETYYWATDAAEPPNTLSWPKNLDRSEALSGKADSSGRPAAIEVEAVSSDGERPQLVSRSLQPTGSASGSTDKVIVPEKGDVHLKENEGSLPQVALMSMEDSSPSQMRTWNAHIRVKKYAYNTSFLIHLFIGHVKNEQPEHYLTKMNQVGFSGIFASADRSNCASCAIQRDEDFLYEDVVPLTSKLLDYLTSETSAGDLIRDGEKKTIDSLDPEEVIPFLKEHLQWRVTDTASNLLGEGGLGGDADAGLQIKVADRLFELPSGQNLLGRYGTSTVHPEITQGKPGGFSP